jgi:hypothetical protein
LVCNFTCQVWILLAFGELASGWQGCGYPHPCHWPLFNKSACFKSTEMYGCKCVWVTCNSATFPL